MGIELVTGYAGKGHVSSLDVGRFNAGMIGNRACVLDTGKRFECTIIDRNHLEVASGDLVKDGRHFTIEEGAVEEVTLSNCQEGYRRKDIICVRYKKNSTSGVETADMIVKEGIATTGTPVAPGCTGATLHQPATVTDEIALWTVELSGSSIVRITPTVITETSKHVQLNYRQGKQYKVNVSSILNVRTKKLNDSINLIPNGKKIGSLKNGEIVTCYAAGRVGDAIWMYIGDDRAGREQWICADTGTKAYVIQK